MINFMERYFPEEVKEKQRSNEHAAAVDRFGEWAEEKCLMM
jgi:E3 ubiquitin-protein ligase BAH